MTPNAPLIAPLLTKVPQPIKRLFSNTYGRSEGDAKRDESESPLVRQIVDLVTQDRRPGARVLDASCGTGVYARALAKQGYKVTAIDTAPGMLTHARRGAKMLPGGYSGTLSVVDDVSVDGPLPFPDASFDVALLVSASQSFEHPEHILREIRRVLASGGTLYIVYLLPHPNKTLPLRNEVTTRAKTSRPEGTATGLWQRTLTALKPNAERQQPTHQWTSKELLTLVTNAGYTAHVGQTQHWVIVKASTERSYTSAAAVRRKKLSGA